MYQRVVKIARVLEEMERENKATTLGKESLSLPTGGEKEGTPRG